jgi:hypothetical protein
VSRYKYWVFGAGHFGRLACERLRAAKPSAKIRVIDRDCKAFPAGVEAVRGEATDFLRSHLTPQVDAWIVPAVPLHLAYEWLAERLARKRGFQALKVPEGLLPSLPNPVYGLQGQVYCSNADFRCPDDCPEPPALCTITAKPRPLVMHAYLSGLVFDEYSSVVVRSLQLAPGVGGFRAATLGGIYDALQDQRGRFLFSTACKCHAVMNAFALD